MLKKRLINDYVDLYLYAVENGVQKTADNYACSKQTVGNALTIGGDFFKYFSNHTPEAKAPVKEKTLADFKNREILEEIANRGYKGTLSFTKYVNLEQL